MTTETIPDFEARLAAWDAVGRYWRAQAAADPHWRAACEAAVAVQPFFTAENIAYATAAWADALRADRLRSWWTAEVGENTRLRPATVAVIMAGNLPYVGLHDVLSVLLSGCRLLLKPSAKDRPLWEFWLRRLWPYPSSVTLTDDLQGQTFEAVIATGCLAAKALSAGWHRGDVQRLAFCEGGESLNVKLVSYQKKNPGSISMRIIRREKVL